MNSHLLLCVSLLASAISASALQITVDWPQGVIGSYSLPKITANGQVGSGTFEIPEGLPARLVGTGFDIAFSVVKGKLVISPSNRKPKMEGVHWDSKTNTFRFTTAEIQVDTRECDVAMVLTGAPKEPEPSEVRSYKVVCGPHQLRFGGGEVSFHVAADGRITMPQGMAGVVASGSSLTVTGLPIEVRGGQDWQVGTLRPPATGNGTVRLLPGATPYAFRARQGIASFFVNSSGLISLEKDGPFQEVVTLLNPKGEQLAEIMIPGGEEKFRIRRESERVDQAIHDRVMAELSKVKWKKEFEIREKTKLYGFAEEQITYPLELPPGLKPEDLKLLDVRAGRIRAVPFQISESQEKDGGIRSWLTFRSDLPLGESRRFVLTAGLGSKDIPEEAHAAPRLEESPGESRAILQNGVLRVQVPAGKQDFPGGKPLAAVDAPILGLARNDPPQPWAVTGSFVAPEGLKVESVSARLKAGGPLFAIYEISYALSGGGSYVATLELRAGESEVSIGEAVTGLALDQGAFLRLNYGRELLNPDRRLVAGGGTGGYDAYSGPYNKDAGEGGKLNFRLSLYTPNSIGTMRAAAFYKEGGADALLLAVNRPRDWITATRSVWASGPTSGSLRFYDQGEDKYLECTLAAGRRFWVAGLIPMSQMAITGDPSLKAPPVGPDVRLLRRLSDWSLNRYKDLDSGWDEKTGGDPFDKGGSIGRGRIQVRTFEDYLKTNFLQSAFILWTQSVSWDFSAEVAPVSFRSMPQTIGDYAVSRSTWTPEQREQVRQVLLLLTESCEDDANVPHHSMMGGHPNFVMDVKSVLPVSAAAFPNHPRAKAWRDSFMGFLDEWLDVYMRKDVAGACSRGGRWTENISCYAGQCFVALLDSQIALEAYDGTRLAKSPRFLELMRWMRDSFMSPQDGVRMIPPQGAHSRGFEPGSHFWKSFFELGALIAPDAPELSQELRWIETNGKEGKRPDLHSALYTDYGPVFRHDFGGPHESYAHLQNINGMNYRWGNAGIVYYGARNKVWSYNNEETNGDKFDWNAVSAFTAKGKGIAAGPTDGLLYDFDFAQFYRLAGTEGEAYRARGLMLLRDDYIVLSDEVESPETPGRFVWASVYELPEIAQVKPGAPGVDSKSNDLLPRRPDAPPNREGKVRSFAGKGDFLTVVAPVPVVAEAKPFGALVNGEYVFSSASPVDVAESGVSFSGNYGYARPNQLALFQGTCIGLDGFEIRREGGDFGLSAAVGKGEISGRIVGKSGGRVQIRPPKGFDVAKASVTVQGQPVGHKIENGAISFPVEIAQADGIRRYEIKF